MNAESNKQVAMRGYQLFANRDIDGLMALCAEDVDWFGPESDIIPFAGSFQGQEGVGRFFSTMAHAQEYLAFEPQEFLADADKVVVLGHLKARLHSNGNTYESRFVHVITFRDRKIQRFEHLSDTAAAMQAYAAGVRTGTSTRTDLPMHH